MEELDLTKAESGCGANSASVRLLKFWLEVGGNREIKVIAQKGITRRASKYVDRPYE